MLKKIFFILITIISSTNAIAQNTEFHSKIFNIGVLPGLGLSGKNPETISNFFSINLIGGYHHSNNLLEISGGFSAQVYSTSGLQISGLSNIIGINNSDSDSLDSNMKGGQISLLYNYVKDYTHGFQGSLINETRNLLGVQIGGFNTIKSFGIGLQAGSVYNFSKGPFDGTQVSGLSNFVTSRFVGLQLAPLNYAALIEGKNSDVDDLLSGFQIGLFNFSKEMHGWQIGLINYAKEMRGKQLGIVNISAPGKIPAHKKSGNTIGFLNVRHFESINMYINEIFYYNVNFSTGSFQNSAIRNKKFNEYLSGTIGYSWNAFTTYTDIKAINLGLAKTYYNYSITPGQNEKNYFRFNVGYSRIFYKDENEKQNNLFKSGVEYGIKPFAKLSTYLFAGLNYNYSLEQNPVILSDENFFSSIFPSSRSWAGVSFGVKLH